LPGPVIIVDYDANWPAQYAEEKRLIETAIGPYLVAIEHMGSTSVPGLAAKPIIDIMAGVRSLADAEQCKAPLAAIGYIYQRDDTIPDRVYFNKGPQAQHRHLHMAELGGAFWRRHLALRDYLRAHAEMAGAYATLKRRLAARFGNDREGYTEAKTVFVEGVVSAQLNPSGKSVWSDLAGVLAAMGAAGQIDAVAHLAQAFWLAVRADVDVDTVVVLATQLVNRLGADHAAAPFVAASAFYVNRKRGEGNPMQPALEQLARQNLALCATARGVADGDLAAWFRGNKLGDPDHVGPALGAALDELTRDAGWLFDRGRVDVTTDE